MVAVVNVLNTDHALEQFKKFASCALTVAEASHDEANEANTANKALTLSSGAQTLIERCR